MPSRKPPSTRVRRTAYRRLLRDPRWQRKRLQVFLRDRWTCQACGATGRELQVHHTVYLPDKAPWEASMLTLVTLCVTCHRKERRTRRGR